MRTTRDLITDIKHIEFHVDKLNERVDNMDKKLDKITKLLTMGPETTVL